MFLNYQYLINKKFTGNSARFSFFFASLIAPNFTNNFTNFLDPNLNLKKIQVKQSYILFTWFYYLTMVVKKKKTLKLFILPIKKKKITYLKAPIAHKNWSKEQFNFQFYLVRISYKSDFKFFEFPDSINAGVLFVLLSKFFFPVFETNTLFLKNYKIIFLLNEKKYFDYFRVSK